MTLAVLMQTLKVLNARAAMLLVLLLYVESVTSQ